MLRSDAYALIGWVQDHRTAFGTANGGGYRFPGASSEGDDEIGGEWFHCQREASPVHDGSFDILPGNPIRVGILRGHACIGIDDDENGLSFQNVVGQNHLLLVFRGCQGNCEKNQREEKCSAKEHKSTSGGAQILP